MWSAHRSWRFYLPLLRKSSHIDLRGIDIIISYFTKSEHHHLRTKILVLHSKPGYGTQSTKQYYRTVTTDKSFRNKIRKLKAYPVGNYFNNLHFLSGIIFKMSCL